MGSEMCIRDSIIIIIIIVIVIVIVIVIITITITIIIDILITTSISIIITAMAALVPPMACLGALLGTVEGAWLLLGALLGALGRSWAALDRTRASKTGQDRPERPQERPETTHRGH